METFRSSSTRLLIQIHSEGFVDFTLVLKLIFEFTVTICGFILYSFMLSVDVARYGKRSEVNDISLKRDKSTC